MIINQNIVPGHGVSDVVVSDLRFNDGIKLLFGNDEDFVQVLRAATLAANEELTGVIVGTGSGSVTLATPANSMLFSNVTDDGDIVFYVATGGDSYEAGRFAVNTSPQFLLPQVNDASNPTLAFGDGDTGFMESADDTLSVVVDGAAQWEFGGQGSGYFQSDQGSGPAIFNFGAAAVAVLIPNRSDLDTGIGQAAGDQLSLIAGDFEMMRLTENLVADDESAITMAGPTKTTTSDGTTSGRILDILARTYNWDGGVNITTPIDGIGLRILAPVIASDATLVITQLSTLYVAAPDVSDAEVTGTLVLAAEFDGGVLMTGGRLQTVQGSDIASGTNITLPSDGNVFELTGTTKVDLISNVGWQEGAEIMLVANENVVIDDGTATSGTNITIVLAGGADFSMTAEDTLTLVLCSITATGQAWREKTRSAN